jgi:hypothetical protein
MRIGGGFNAYYVYFRQPCFVKRRLNFSYNANASCSKTDVGAQFLVSCVFAYSNVARFVGASNSTRSRSKKKNLRIRKERRVWF